MPYVDLAMALPYPSCQSCVECTSALCIAKRLYPKVSDLVRLTILLNVAPADQRAAKIEERLMDVISALVAYLQAPETVHPRQCPFHHPPVSPLYLPSFSLDSMPRLAIRGVMPLFFKAFRQRAKS